MGQSFSTIVIKRNPEYRKRDIELILDSLGSDFAKIKEDLTPNEFWEEKWRRDTEGLIGISKNKDLIFIEDLYDLIPPELFQEWSKNLKTELLKATSSNTTGFSIINLYDRGKLIRSKTLGLENWEILSEENIETESNKKEEQSIYESEGSDAISVLGNFKKGCQQEDEHLLISIYKQMT